MRRSFIRYCRLSCIQPTAFSWATRVVLCRRSVATSCRRGIGWRAAHPLSGLQYLSCIILVGLWSTVFARQVPVQPAYRDCSAPYGGRPLQVGRRLCQHRPYFRLHDNAKEHGFESLVVLPRHFPCRVIFGLLTSGFCIARNVCQPFKSDIDSTLRWNSTPTGALASSIQKTVFRQRQLKGRLRLGKAATPVQRRCGVAPEHFIGREWGVVEESDSATWIGNEWMLILFVTNSSSVIFRLESSCCHIPFHLTLDVSRATLPSLYNPSPECEKKRRSAGDSNNVTATDLSNGQHSTTVTWVLLTQKGNVKAVALACIADLQTNCYYTSCTFYSITFTYWNEMYQ